MHKNKKTPGSAGAPTADFETWARATPGLPSFALLLHTVVEVLRIALAALVLLSTATTTQAQWDIEDSHTTASLRGIHNVGGGVAWASGTNGTVLRTEDGGYLWQTCAIPLAGTKDTAEKLDFRGIQAFDENTAIVMSSGPGDQSRLYKTTDGCQTWKLLFTNPDKDGFWDALLYEPDFELTVILGDPVKGRFRLFTAVEDGKFSDNWNRHPIPAAPNQAAFAASNSLIVENVGEGQFSFITGGSKSEIIHEEHGIDHKKGMFSEWSRSSLPFESGESSGAFSIAAAPYNKATKTKTVIVVGGDYKRPDYTASTAMFSTDWGYKFALAQTPPHGYRSAVAYNTDTKTWITVGPNGTDISTDDGRNWRPLTPTPQDIPGADKDWNALSLPFVVGPKGRIGKLRPDALTSPSKNQVKDKK